MKRLSVVPTILVAALTVAAVPAVALTLIDTSNVANVKLIAISRDPFTNPDSQHATEVEPDTFAFGSTMVSVFQQGRYSDGGGSDIGWATSTDGGKTWKRGSFKGITKIENPKNPYDRASDTSIAYDAKHRVWLAEVLPLTGTTGQQPVVAISPDGLKWGPKPVKVAPDNGDFIDKPWIVCDNWKSSKFYGHCYIEEDDFTLGAQELMLTSTDGGKSWSAPFTVAGLFGEGGQPVVQPNGTVIVPDFNLSNTTITAYRSTDGGTTWGNAVTVAPVSFHSQANANFRDSAPFPSAETDGKGTVYVAWADCSFRTGCPTDDIVYATSVNGQSWSAVKRVPIDAVTSPDDHFIPGIAVDAATSGTHAHVALSFYFFPQGNCASTTCKLFAGFISSTNGGTTWSKPKVLAGPIQLPWLALTNQGYMVGDYISTSFLSGTARPGIESAKAPKGGVLNEFTATSAMGLPSIFEPFENSAQGDRWMPNIGHLFRAPHVPAI